MRVKQLAQLQSDVDSALGRFMTECVRQAAKVAPELSEEWMRRAGLVEETREWMRRDCVRWIEEDSNADGG